jgi:signal transduction histidine kinase
LQFILGCDVRVPTLLYPETGATMTVESTADRGMTDPLSGDERRTVRWLTALGYSIVGFVVVASFLSRPAPAFSGPGLRVAAALAGVAVGMAGLLRRGNLGFRQLAPFFALLIFSSAVLVRIHPGGPGMVGLYAASTIAGFRLRRLQGALVAGSALLAFVIASVLAGLLSPLAIAGACIGIVTTYAISALAGRLREEQLETRRLLARLEASQADASRAAALAERAHLAREMHDILAHSLSALALQLAAAQLLATQRGSDPEVIAALDRAHQFARTGIDEARRAVGMLREDALPGPERLENLAVDLQTATGIPCAVHVSGEKRDLDPDARLAVYRVAQEALSNVRKHASAERVRLELGYAPNGTSLTVEDFSSAPSVKKPSGQRGYGLTGMRERAELLGGTLTAGPTDSGFRVSLWLPA